MKNGFLLIAGLLSVACSDFAKKDQLVKITDLQKKNKRFRRASNEE